LARNILQNLVSDTTGLCLSCANLREELSSRSVGLGLAEIPMIVRGEVRVSVRHAAAAVADHHPNLPIRLAGPGGLRAQDSCVELRRLPTPRPGRPLHLLIEWSVPIVRSRPLVHGDRDLLLGAGMTPLLAAVFLGDEIEAVPGEDSDDLTRGEASRSRGHQILSSTTFAPGATSPGIGSR